MAINLTKCFFSRVGTDTHALLESANDNLVPQINGDNDNDRHDYENGSTNYSMSRSDTHLFEEKIKFSFFFPVTKDNTRFVTGFQLQRSQITAMAIKKSLYSIRNFILLLLQFFIPALFIVITMLTESFNEGDKDLPALAISFNEYLETVTTVERASITNGSFIENVSTNFESIINGLSDVHSLTVTNSEFQEEILDQYRISLSNTNLKYMVGVTFDDSLITAWFNNQGYHTAPLAINTINNAILR